MILFEAGCDHTEQALKRGTLGAHGGDRSGEALSFPAWGPAEHDPEEREQNQRCADYRDPAHGRFRRQTGFRIICDPRRSRDPGKGEKKKAKAATPKAKTTKAEPKAKAEKAAAKTNGAEKKTAAKSKTTNKKKAANATKAQAKPQGKPSKPKVPELAGE